MAKLKLTIELLKVAAKEFVASDAGRKRSDLYGVTDGKKIGTAIEHSFRDYVASRFEFTRGNSGSGLDFPDIDVDLKVTSEKQPQSSSPFRSATQKVYGLGYHLLVMVYQKTDDPIAQTALLNYVAVVFIDRSRTADHSLTTKLNSMVSGDADTRQIAEYLAERGLPLNQVELSQLAERVVEEPPEIGAITISNALQWRLNYGGAISLSKDSEFNGVEGLIDE
jgi:hypothetical protein